MASGTRPRGQRGRCGRLWAGADTGTRRRRPDKEVSGGMEAKYKEAEERYRAEREEAARSDDSLACAEERLATKRAAELKKRVRVIEQQLPVTTGRLGILWNEVTGSSRPMPSEIQLTSTGAEMTAEEHVATAETHLRYAEGHLQLSEEHLADAEVHLKLVKAHLAALVAMEPAGADPPEAAALPLPKPASGEASAGRTEVTPEERDRSPAARPRVRSVQRGSESDSKTLHPGAGEGWTCQQVSGFGSPPSG
jgi:hypothetical protein